MSGLVDLRLGFIPLTDCAPLVVAKTLGFFAEEGLDVELSREVSWATLRDKVTVGALDGAHTRRIKRGILRSQVPLR